MMASPHPIVHRIVQDPTHHLERSIGADRALLTHLLVQVLQMILAQVLQPEVAHLRDDIPSDS